MQDPYEAIEQLAGAQLVERVEAIGHDMRYWQAVLDEAGVLNDGIGRMVEAIADGTVATLSLASMVDERGMAFVSDAMTALSRAVSEAHKLQQPVKALLELANGRGLALDPQLAALQRAVDGSTGDEAA